MCWAKVLFAVYNTPAHLDTQVRAREQKRRKRHARRSRHYRQTPRVLSEVGWWCKQLLQLPFKCKCWLTICSGCSPPQSRNDFVLVFLQNARAACRLAARSSTILKPTALSVPGAYPTFRHVCYNVRLITNIGRIRYDILAFRTRFIQPGHVLVRQRGGVRRRRKGCLLRGRGTGENTAVGFGSCPIAGPSRVSWRGVCVGAVCYHRDGNLDVPRRNTEIYDMPSRPRGQIETGFTSSRYHLFGTFPMPVKFLRYPLRTNGSSSFLQSSAAEWIKPNDCS